MKKIIVTIAAALMAFSVAANNAGGDPNSYCVEERDGKKTVIYNGSELTKKIKLENGTKLKPNGTIVLAGGKRVRLTEGECVDVNNLGQWSDRKGTFEERMDSNKERRKAKREERRARRDSYM
jgi:hypothetical protein